jgi:hypothetical protein
MSYYNNNLRGSELSSRRAKIQDNSGWRRGQNTAVFVHSRTLGPIMHTILIGLMIAVLGLIYLTQVTKQSTFGYEAERRQQTLADLSAKRDELKNENDRLQALNRVSQSNVAKAMTDPAATDYARN